MSDAPNIVNLTPHAINIVDEKTKAVIRTFPPGGPPARCQELRSPAEDLDGVPFTVVSYGEVFDLPPQDLKTRYIVSMLVAQTLGELREDLCFVGPLVRDDAGVIIGATGLARFDYF